MAKKKYQLPCEVNLALGPGWQWGTFGGCPGETNWLLVCGDGSEALFCFDPAPRPL